LPDAEQQQVLSANQTIHREYAGYFINPLPNNAENVNPKNELNLR
jgi:hypothetical protein